MEIGQRIRELRGKKGMSLTELATRAGVAKSYISSVERGIQLNPSIQFLTKVSNVLNVNVETLINGTGDKDESQLDAEWVELAKEAAHSGVSKEQFKQFLEFQKWQRTNQ
ncbi:transcriptional regulator [Priestia veravalensis]|uniref:Transcriptional regulator n=1 Tax=Priestia veravalensis TaxID=1414648 RepID=A0A0V8JR17_9BACI|nr:MULTISPECIES: helix-turn-helix domain-containing protein [Priestia]KSU89072.1 transcriptional regulator [Priestia veravalensis]SCB95295.1 Transcriptional regulator, contains XRE-family HTH domain [Priestia flexa]